METSHFERSELNFLAPRKAAESNNKEREEQRRSERVRDESFKFWGETEEKGERERLKMKRKRRIETYYYPFVSPWRCPTWKHLH